MECIVLRPISEKEWNEAKAAHLLNRAGFGATLDETARAARRHPAEVVEALVHYESVEDPTPPPDWVGPESNRRERPRRLQRMDPDEREAVQKARREEEQEHLLSLRTWWLARMRHGPRPLQEKLTLFWHGHFATGFTKVKSAYAMYLQNQTLRAHAGGNYEALVTAVAQDPAMLVYLDNAMSSAAAPNENFARELMELFMLGEGHYTEDDVREAARAFTGWTLAPERIAFREAPRRHDQRSKDFLGKKGNHDGYDILRILLGQPRAAEFIVRKLWEFFAYPDPEPEIVEGLSRTLREEQYELRPLLVRMLRSRAFYSRKAHRTQIKSPVQFLIAALRSLELDLPQPERVVQRALRLLGQNLFDPPNVKGWPGGYAWIHTGSLLQRHRMTDTLVMGRPSGDAAFPVRTRIDPDRLLPPGARKDRTTCRNYLQSRLFQSVLLPHDAARMDACFATKPPPAQWSDQDVQEVLSFMMRTPYYQLT